MGNSIYDEKMPVVAATVLTDATTPGSAVVFNPATLASRIDNLFLSTDNSTDVTVEVIVLDSASNTAKIVTVLVPLGSGFTAGVPAVDALAGIVFASGGLVLGANCALEVNVPAALDSGKQLAVLVLGGYI